MTRALHLAPALMLACTSGDASPDEVDPPVSTGSLTIQAVPADHAAATHFDRFAEAFGVPVYASPTVPEAKLLHAVTILAEYLDNDEDGEADLPEALTTMLAERATLIMFASGDEMDSSGVFDSPFLDQIHGQDLHADETAPADRFDAALEEVLHLVQHGGYSLVHPDRLGTERGTELTAAMDLARGGDFERPPASYPEGAWYTYADSTCDYGCQAGEYFYWGLTTLLGAQAEADRCASIADEWAPCTAEALRATDVALVTLLEDAALGLPTRLPDGVYAP